MFIFNFLREHPTEMGKWAEKCNLEESEEIVKNSESEFLNNGIGIEHFRSCWLFFFVHQSKYTWHEYDWNRSFSSVALNMWESNHNICLAKKDLLSDEKDFFTRRQELLLCESTKGLCLLFRSIFNES